MTTSWHDCPSYGGGKAKQVRGVGGEFRWTEPLHTPFVPLLMTMIYQRPLELASRVYKQPLKVYAVGHGWPNA